MHLKDEAESFLEQYFHWLKEETSLREASDEWIEITTPYLDRHNDYLQIYVKKEGANFLVTDDGYILSDLASSGCDFTSHLKEALTYILRRFDIVLVEETQQLTISVSPQELPFKTHSLIQAMLAVDALFYLSRQK